MDPLAAIAAISGLVAVGLGVATFSQTRARNRAEAALAGEREERERREALAQAPNLIVEFAGAHNESGGLERRVVQIRVRNLGPTIARKVEVGSTIPNGRVRAGNVIEALAVDEEGQLEMTVPQKYVERYGLDAIDHGELWATWTDALGNRYELPQS